MLRSPLSARLDRLAIRTTYDCDRMAGRPAGSPRGVFRFANRRLDRV
jgi:hypothetical protein